VEKLRSEHSITQLDIVLANAAIHPGHRKFHEISAADLDATYLTNIRGPILLFQAVLPLMDEKKSKYIVLSSGAGTLNQQHRNNGGGAYGQSKVCVLKLDEYTLIPAYFQIILAGMCRADEARRIGSCELFRSKSTC
jgi:NAD(P)-dependent dehydrogenase (short-subunit alcohol dehydrogenase family)